MKRLFSAIILLLLLSALFLARPGATHARPLYNCPGPPCEGNITLVHTNEGASTSFTVTNVAGSGATCYFSLGTCSYGRFLWVDGNADGHFIYAGYNVEGLEGCSGGHYDAFYETTGGHITCIAGNTNDVGFQMTIQINNAGTPGVYHIYIRVPGNNQNYCAPCTVNEDTSFAWVGMREEIVGNTSRFTDKTNWTLNKYEGTDGIFRYWTADGSVTGNNPPWIGWESGKKPSQTTNGGTAYSCSKDGIPGNPC